MGAEINSTISTIGTENNVTESTDTLQKNVDSKLVSITLKSTEKNNTIKKLVEEYYSKLEKTFNIAGIEGKHFNDFINKIIKINNKRGMLILSKRDIDLQLHPEKYINEIISKLEDLTASMLEKNIVNALFSFIDSFIKEKTIVTQTKNLIREVKGAFLNIEQDSTLFGINLERGTTRKEIVKEWVGIIHGDLAKNSKIYDIVKGVKGEEKLEILQRLLIEIKKIDMNKLNDDEVSLELAKIDIKKLKGEVVKPKEKEVDEPEEEVVDESEEEVVAKTKEKTVAKTTEKTVAKTKEVKEKAKEKPEGMSNTVYNYINNIEGMIIEGDIVKYKNKTFKISENRRIRENLIRKDGKDGVKETLFYTLSITQWKNSVDFKEIKGISGKVYDYILKEGMTIKGKIVTYGNKTFNIDENPKMSNNVTRGYGKDGAQTLPLQSRSITQWKNSVDSKYRNDT
ncbi:MAG: hypothetical protein Q9M94_01545 [Candidatus Gracilibacteria bacterium]|nr:hypothetical protein [Candidatus Gracilibacteria bacterium]